MVRHRGFVTYLQQISVFPDFLAVFGYPNVSNNCYEKIREVFRHSECLDTSFSF